MDDQTANERLALLLGWVRTDPDDDPMVWAWFPLGYDPETDESPSGQTSRGSYGPPDFLNDWTRFHELQAYVRGLDRDVRHAVLNHVELDTAIIGGRRARGDQADVLYITPRILGMSILEVCGSEVEA